MANSLIPAEILTQRILAESIPIIGLSYDGGVARIDFDPSATLQQRVRANQIVTAFDGSKTADEKTDEIDVPIRVLAALIEVVGATAAGQTPDTWARIVLAAARAKLKGVRT